MTEAVQIFVLAVSALLVLYLLADTARARAKRRHESEFVDRVNGNGSAEDAGPRRGWLDQRLRAAGLRGPAEAYLFAGSLLAAVVSLALLALVPAVPLVAVVGLALMLYLEWTTVVSLARRRSTQFELKLIDAIDLMIGALSAGATLTQAMQEAGAASPPPLRGEFAEAVRRLGLGMPVRRALATMVEDYNGEGIRLFSQTIAAKQDAGGEITPVLRSLNETLRDRARQQRQVRVQLAGVRVTAIGVALLPYLMAFVLITTQPGWFGPLVNNSATSALIFVAVMLQLIGMLWLWRILRTEM